MLKSILKAVAFLVSAAAILFCAYPYATAQDLTFSSVHREILESRLKRYAGDNDQRYATLKSMFLEAGCPADRLSEQSLTEAHPHFPPNVICTLPGTSDRVILVGAYFTDAKESAGVVFNWSAAAMLPSLYQALKIRPHQHTYVFIGFTGGGFSKRGARRYVQEMSNPQIEATDAMICLRALGLGATEVWARRSDKNLYHDLTVVAKALNLKLEGFNVDDFVGSFDERNSTEATEFADRKIPTITIHSLTERFMKQESLSLWINQLSAVNMDYYYQSYRLVAAYLAHLDQR